MATTAESIEVAEPIAAMSLSGSPDDIDDVALVAGGYLCAAGGDLGTAEGQQRAIPAYNHSGVYLDQVQSAATGYGPRSGLGTVRTTSVGRSW